MFEMELPDATKNEQIAMFEILNTKNIVAVTATANVIKKASKCNVHWQSFGSPPDHCLTRFGGPTGFLVLDCLLPGE